MADRCRVRSGPPCDNDQLKLQAGDGGPMPRCAPGKPCDNDQLKLQAGDGGPLPMCAPGKPCNTTVEAAGRRWRTAAAVRSGPALQRHPVEAAGRRWRASPLCAPGKPCNNDQLKLQAGDGGPPRCALRASPATHQLKLQAGDGGPAPLCAPGKPCDNSVEAAGRRWRANAAVRSGQHCNIQQERLPMAL